MKSPVLVMVSATKAGLISSSSILWLKDHFLTNAISHRPLLLLLDGHSSHFEPQSIEFARQNDIVIFCLPPHTTHECQPLDVSLFGPLKKYWQQECHKFYQNNPSFVISKLNFNRIFRVAWLRAVSPSNLCGGFRKSGVFPFNRGAVTVTSGNGESNGDEEAYSGDDNNEGDLSTKLKYIHTWNTKPFACTISYIFRITSYCCVSHIQGVGLEVQKEL